MSSHPPRLVADPLSRKRGCWLTDHADIPVPPSKDDFVMAGNLQKRRGGFGKIATQSWRNRCFVLLKTGNLCYFEAGVFDSVNFCDPPRGILTLDEDVIISKYPRADGDDTGDMALIIQGGGQRWKLCSEAPGEINRWEEALRSMAKGRASPSRIVANSLRSPTFDPRVKKASRVRDSLQRTFDRTSSSTNGAASPSPARATGDQGKVDGGAENQGGVLSFVCTLAILDAVCCYLYKYEVTVEIFFSAMLLVNVVVGSSLSRRAQPTPRHQRRVGVPLIHWGDVGPLRAAIKRRFPPKKDVSSLQLGDVGEVACGVPTASSTMEHYAGLPGNLTAPIHSWTNGDSSVFRVRGRNYIQDRLKVVPVESLYEMVGMDTFATEARVGNMASEVFLDSVTRDLPEINVPRVPPLLVINVQLPSASPALMSSAEDGPGYQCVFYFRMREDTVRALGNMETACEGVRLWVEYCQHIGLDDDHHGRFKCIAQISNSDSLGLPNFVTKYNGKPVLINKSGNWVRGENYMENTINVHRFSFIAKKSLHAIKGMFKDMVLHLGFTIEGRSADELPEVMLACGTLNYPSLERAVEFDV